MAASLWNENGQRRWIVYWCRWRAWWALIAGTCRCSFRQLVLQLPSVRVQALPASTSQSTTSTDSSSPAQTLCICSTTTRQHHCTSFSRQRDVTECNWCIHTQAALGWVVMGWAALMTQCISTETFTHWVTSAAHPMPSQHSVCVNAP